MRTIICLAAILLSSPAHAGFYWPSLFGPSPGPLQLPATFTFGFERAGAEVSLSLVVPDDVAIGEYWNATITAANADSYGFGWDAFRGIVGSTQGIGWTAWWGADVPLHSKYASVPAGHRFVQGGATAPNHFPDSFRLEFGPGIGETPVQSVMTIEDSPGTPLPPIPGDFDFNAQVDIQDYTLWRKSFGSTTNLIADANGDGVIDTGDYVVWRKWNGTNGWPSSSGHSSVSLASGLGSQSIPEPATVLLLLLAVTCCPRGNNGRR